MIKSGDGSQTATWKVPVPEVGQYDLYYHVFKDDELRWNNNLQGEYHFKVKYGSEVEDAYVNLRKANEGWEQLGSCLLYTSPSPRDPKTSRMPSSA